MIESFLNSREIQNLYFLIELTETIELKFGGRDAASKQSTLILNEPFSEEIYLLKSKDIR